MSEQTLKDAARRLKLLVGDAAFVGINTVEGAIYVYQRGPRRRGLRLIKWEGFPVVWHENVGPIMAAAA